MISTKNSERAHQYANRADAFLHLLFFEEDAHCDPEMVIATETFSQQQTQQLVDTLSVLSFFHLYCGKPDIAKTCMHMAYDAFSNNRSQLSKVSTYRLYGMLYCFNINHQQRDMWLQLADQLEQEAKIIQTSVLSITCNSNPLDLYSCSSYRYLGD
jgi:hypothetical protein